MSSCDDEDIVGRIETELEASDAVRTELNAIVDSMEDVLKQLSPPPPIQPQQIQTQEQSAVYAGVTRRTPNCLVGLWHQKRQPYCPNWK